jgi:excisionase family DNA binding protein
MELESTPTYWDIGELMSRLHVKARQTIYRYVELDGLPAHRLPGGAYLFDPLEVDAWVKSRCTSPDAGQVA